MEMMVAIAVAFVGVAVGACLGLLVVLLAHLRTSLRTFDEAATKLHELAAMQGESWKGTAEMVQEGIAALRLIRNAVEVQASRHRYAKPSRFRPREEEELDPWTSPMDEPAGGPEVGVEP